jgi:hypothetical protein
MMVIRGSTEWNLVRDYTQVLSRQSALATLMADEVNRPRRPSPTLREKLEDEADASPYRAWGLHQVDPAAIRQGHRHIALCQEVAKIGGKFEPST